MRRSSFISCGRCPNADFACGIILALGALSTVSVFQSHSRRGWREKWIFRSGFQSVSLLRDETGRGHETHAGHHASKKNKGEASFIKSADSPRYF
jgi:hypothetical protein